ncbi:MAG TPA: 2'-5' RNA ligase family protein [Mycobacteriales bacterium]|nr:2'-5' RNA ligase family protein [Mycobacteriales bacterium]
MTIGVMAWFDEETEERIRLLWRELAALGVPALGSAAGPHPRPHVSYLYTDHLDVTATITALSRLPKRPPLTVRLGAVALFPPRILHLPVIPTTDLLDRHRSVFDVASGSLADIRPFHVPGRWSPHVTLARSVPRGLADVAVETVAAYLPIEGTLATGGIEDADSGQAWTASTLP